MKARLRSLLSLPCVLALVFAPAIAQSETVSAIWELPPDINAYYGPAGKKPEDPARDTQYDCEVPGLGEFRPRDVRSVLKEMGVTLRDGDLALGNDKPAMLYVRTTREAVQQLDSIMEDLNADSSDGLYPVLTFTLRHTAADGTREDVMRRSLICPGGQRAKFERRRAGRLVEMIEIEATLQEDHTTVDLNTAVEYRMKDAALKVTTQALLTGGADEATLLCAAPGKTIQDRYEVFASAKVTKLPVLTFGNFSPAERKALAARLDVALKQSPPPVPAGPVRSELYFCPAPPWNFPPVDPFAPAKENTLRLSIPGMGTEEWEDVSEECRTVLQAPLSPGDVVRYATTRGLLYLRTNAAAQALMATHCPPCDVFDGSQEMEATLHSWRETPGSDAPVPFAPRTLRLRQGYRGQMTVPGRKEKIEMETTLDSPGQTAVVHVALEQVRMEGETWTVSTQVTVPSDGTSRTALVSGMAKDSGGAEQHLAVSVQPRHSRWLETVRDDQRRRAALAEIEKALPAATPEKK